MKTEHQKMLAGELYDPMNPELVAARAHARDLCQALNATREAEQEEQEQAKLDDKYERIPIADDDAEQGGGEQEHAVTTTVKFYGTAVRSK